MNVDGLAGGQIVLTSYETLFNDPGCQLWKLLIRRCFPFLACIFLIVLVGCFGAAIPTPVHLVEGRGKIDESDIAFLTLSKTTREEVLLRFGEPDLVLDDQRILIYHWKLSYGYWFIAIGGTGDAGPIPKDYLFMLEFDEKGRLKRFERSGIMGSNTFIRLDDWTPLNSKKLSGLNGLRRDNIFIDPIPSTCAQTVSLDIESLPTRFRVGEFFDNRASPYTGTFIGDIEDFSIRLFADVQTCRPANVIIRAAVTNQLQAMKHKLVSKNANVTITGKITKFEVTMSSVISGSLDVILKVQPSAGKSPKNIRRYKAKEMRYISVWNYLGIKDTCEKVMQACLEDMQRQIVSDVELIRLLGGGIE